jgi:MerR family transcriptional regulator, light-induced transcriptional regulator
MFRGEKMEAGLDFFQSTANALSLNRETLARDSVDRQYAARPEDWVRYKQAGYAKSLRDANYHFTYLSEAIATNNFLLFLDYITWLKVIFNSNHFPASALEETLKHMKPAVTDVLPAEQAVQVVQFLDRAIEQIPSLPVTIQSYLSQENPYFELATQYLKILLNGRRREAYDLILNAVTSGVPIKDIYLHIFQVTQREIGRLWQINKISVAQEHYCTASTQTIISQLYQHVLSNHNKGPRMLATCVGDELHELGMRMVADFFEMEGWDTYFLGANTPTHAILSALEERGADILAVSATLTPHISHVSTLIQSVRLNETTAQVKVIVGGYPFNLSDQLWQTIGADGYAPDAQAAIEVANRLVA